MTFFAEFQTTHGRALVNVAHVIAVQAISNNTCLLILSRDGPADVQESTLQMSYDEAVKAVAEARIRLFVRPL